MAAPVYWTAEMVRALPEDGNRYECVHGELLVTPSPRPWHQIVVDRLHFALRTYLHSVPSLFLFACDSDISWSEDTLVQPDLFVLPREEVRPLVWSAMQHLVLTIEVLSPSSKRADRFTKRRLYQEVGIPLYWIVDADAHEVEVWTPDVRFPAVARERLSWQPDGAERPFALALAELFEPV
ncbi:MAG: Uma2 family endonuclease [Gemmatimonadales bacterium]